MDARFVLRVASGSFKVVLSICDSKVVVLIADPSSRTSCQRFLPSTTPLPRLLAGSFALLSPGRSQRERDTEKRLGERGGERKGEIKGVEVCWGLKRKRRECVGVCV